MMDEGSWAPTFICCRSARLTPTHRSSARLTSSRRRSAHLTSSRRSTVQRTFSVGHSLHGSGGWHGVRQKLLPGKGGCRGAAGDEQEGQNGV
jgi:hypothetical protein